MTSCLDPGHGYNTAGKRSPDGSLLEYEFNQAVADIAERMLRQRGKDVVLTKKKGDPDVPLGTRCKIANNEKAKCFISIHANAHLNTWSNAGGFEVYHFPGSNTGRKLAEIAHKHLRQKLKIRDRGIKQANFAVLRETNMPAILIEFAFFTNQEECALLKTDAFREACAEVVVLTEIEYTGDPGKAAAPVSNGNKMPIIGKQYLTAGQLDAYVRSKNPNAPDLVDYYLKLGDEMGIRGDIAFCQSCKETKFFKFGGDVLPEQNNFAGIGTTGGGVRGAYFDTPRQGILAQLQHLWAYATKDPLPAGMEVIDPRFDLVSRGSAPCWEDLSGKWATDPGYGRSIIHDFYAEAKSFPDTSRVPKEDGAEIEEPGPSPQPLPEVKKAEKKQKVLHTAAIIEGQALPAVVIEGKGYVGVSDIENYLDLNALWDKKNSVIMFLRR
ncbi:cell wall hydrolase/autolysin [Desulforamulus reducens MI-1]|uniref:Cell wall hydrolase/autolysin n=1 Tax=Desulforamulus reducens (strain ATCC BAA-1160 / DSM 100696 / MI-1) TaxID=349161 RepID=A4J3V9_DESRM|nr:N-acetylmuramoyl-L-alanine amidase [Desulforamulus reducens]ABO49762.1 cell wall hydrolase/autolysin [Desulforamulus reducens MI-1]